MEHINFGTDGWRGIIGKDFTFSNVAIVAQAIADYVKSDSGKHCYNKNLPPKIVIGYDNRFLSEKFAALVAEVFAGNKIEVFLSKEPIPTPAVSLAVLKEKAACGIVITASHNPPEFNGVKIKASYGGSALPYITKDVEKKLYKNPVKRISLEEGKKKNIIKLVSLKKDHIKTICNYINMDILKNAGFKVMADCMYGTTYDYFNVILKDTNCKVTAIHNFRDPLFGGLRPEPIACNLKEFLAKVKHSKADVGVVTDGDSDRVGAADEDGNFIDSQHIVALLALHLIKNKGMTGGIVQTSATTFMVNKIAQKYKLKIYQTPIGFKYITQHMLEDDILIGGEESGGVGIKGYIPERDGVLCSMLLLEMMAVEKKSLKQLMKDLACELGPFYYDRADIHYPVEKREKLISCIAKNPPKKMLGVDIKDILTYDGIKFILQDNSWLLIRGSGTEPLLRIYAESNSKNRVKLLLESGKKIIEREL
ncbi:MAG: phosphoglucomutase/phosphomannomutase family protein [Candidatus Firestonebacteria bacterium]